MDFTTLLILGLGAVTLYELLNQTVVGGPPAAVAVPGSDMTTIQTPNVDLAAKIQQFADAIAHAEGFGVAGAVPTTHHNPGDLGPGDCPGYQSDYHSGSYVCLLPDDATGWVFLLQKVENAFTGQSGVYSPRMTILQWAHSYAGDWQNWANNVASYLGVTPDTVIADWINS